MMLCWLKQIYLIAKSIFLLHHLLENFMLNCSGKVFVNITLCCKYYYSTINCFLFLNRRIVEPDGEVFTKNAIQKFIQDPKNPAHMINHDNDYLHYKVSLFNYIVCISISSYINIWNKGRLVYPGFRTWQIRTCILHGQQWCMGWLRRSIFVHKGTNCRP
jgi:hypothetical protein